MRLAGVVCGLALLACLLACGGGVGKAPPVRAEVRRALQGKTAEDVRRVMGRPEWTTDSEGGRMWYYRRGAIDPETGRAGGVWVHFGPDGRVAEVDF
jgi:outer membrane protein assembly factor BamE (lipoprotein component of BamABCDE complex)